MATTHQSTRPDAIPALTGLRFIAAVLVLFAHALPKIFPVKDPEPPLYTLMHGTALIGMPLFFVLSGFVIQYNYAAQLREHGAVGMYNFIVARFARLYPLFLACLLFDLANKWSYAQLPAQTLDALPFYLTLTHSWLYQAYEKFTLTFIFGWMPQVSWSISAEWFFYLCFPLICFCLHKISSLRTLIFSAVAIAALTMCALLLLSLNKGPINDLAVAYFGPLADNMAGKGSQSFYQWVFAYAPYPRLLEFTLGCMAAKAFVMTAHNLPSLHEQRYALYAMLAAIAAGLFVLIMLDMPGIAPDGRFQFVTDLRYSSAFALPITVLIFCCARYSNAITHALSAKYMVLCGEISFSIYMLHMLIIGAFRWETATVTSWEIGVGNALRMIVVIAVTIGLSLVSYTLIEMPAKKWLTRRLSYRPKAASTAPVNS